MANYNITPYMKLRQPLTGIDTAPDWANNLNWSLSTIDAHTHTSGSGQPITPAAININADLPLNNDFNLTQTRSLRFYNNTSIIASASPDIGCLYEFNGDLYYNDTSTNQIRITQSGGVVGAPGNITGLPNGAAGVAYVAETGSFVFTQATANAANIDASSVVIRYTGILTPSGNCIVLQAPSTLSSGYALTLPALPTQTNVMTLGNTGIISSNTYDQVGQAMTVVGADAIANSMGVGGADAIAATMDATGCNAIVAKVTTVNSTVADIIGTSMGVGGADAIAATMDSTGANTIAAKRTRVTGGSTLGIGGVPNSANFSGNVTTTNTSLTALNLTLTTSGRPVYVSLMSVNGSINTTTASGLGVTFHKINPPGPDTVICTFIYTFNGYSPVSSFNFLDIFAAAGINNYFVYANAIGGGGVVTFSNVYLIAYEI